MDQVFGMSTYGRRQLKIEATTSPLAPASGREYQRADVHIDATSTKRKTIVDTRFTKWQEPGNFSFLSEFFLSFNINVASIKQLIHSEARGEHCEAVSFNNQKKDAEQDSP